MASRTEGRPSFGAREPKVTVEVRVRPWCLSCRDAVRWVRRVARDRSADVQIVVKVLADPALADGWLAAEASYAAHAEGSGERFLERLFERPLSIDRANVACWLEEAGLDAERLLGDVDRGRWRGLAREDLEEHEALGIEALPVVIVAGRRLEGQPYERWLGPIVDEEIARTREARRGDP